MILHKTDYILHFFFTSIKLHLTSYANAAFCNMTKTHALISARNVKPGLKSLWWLWPWLSIPRALVYNLCANLLGSGAEGPYHSPPGSEPLRVLGGSLSLLPSGPDSLSGLSCLLDGQRILHLWLTWPGFNLSGAIV